MTVALSTSVKFGAGFSSQVDKGQNAESAHNANYGSSRPDEVAISRSVTVRLKSGKTYQRRTRSPESYKRRHPLAEVIERTETYLRVRIYGGETLISPQDLPILELYAWKVNKQLPAPYVTANPRWKSPMLYLARVIMQAPKGIEVDHRNNDVLDNRRENLRFATRSQNNRNRRVNRNNKSGYKGVSVDKRCPDRWQAAIYVAPKQIRLGSFSTPEAAALAYNRAALKYYGEFARLNEVCK